MILKDLYIFIKDKLLLNKHASILMYHSISDNSEFFSVSPVEFEWQMRYLLEHNYSIISLDKLVNFIEKRMKIPRRTVVLTFDDGYEDNYYSAFSILKKFNFPATIFLTTGRIGDKEYTNKRGVQMPMLDWEQVREMYDLGLVDFEPHTVSHSRLSQIPPGQVVREIENSKLEIEKRLSKTCQFFCLPYGDYNEKVINIIRKFFSSCFTVERGFVSYSDNPFLLKRNSVDSTVSRIRFILRV